MPRKLGSQSENASYRRIPSVDRILRHPVAQSAIGEFGHSATVEQIRSLLETARRASDTTEANEVTPAKIAQEARDNLKLCHAPHLRRVFNMTGTVLHTNLGRALLPECAIEQATCAMRHPANLEFDIVHGARGERDDHVRGLICELTGAEDAIVVNNNAAAVVLVLNTLALNKGVLVSRGELIEIGGSFRIPDIMAQAGARLVEVGTTNRTHLNDYRVAIDDAVALIMKVHTSNYVIKGFTKSVPASELASLSLDSHIPLVDDLGSGTLINLTHYGLPPERTVKNALDDGADLVTFSGDKLLGGPQAGFIVGQRKLVQACAKNPLKRAMRLDKLRLAALEATLKLYRHPEKLMDTLPTLNHLAKPLADIVAATDRVAVHVQAAVGGEFVVERCDVESQIGSGALPTDTVPSAGLAIRPTVRRSQGRQLEKLATALRDLPIPIIGHLHEGALVLDFRTLDDEAGFIDQLKTAELDLSTAREAE